MATWENEFTGPGTSARIWLVLQVDIVSQDIPGNRTFVNWYLRMEERVNASPYNLNGVSSGAAAVDGTVFSSGGLSYDFRGTNVTQNVASGSKWINHAANGTKTAGVSASYNSGDAILGTASLSDAYPLPTIPRGGGDAWSGSAWIDQLFEVWSGSAWVLQKVEAWSGSAWVVQN